MLIDKVVDHRFIVNRFIIYQETSRAILVRKQLWCHAFRVTKLEKNYYFYRSGTALKDVSLLNSTAGARCKATRRRLIYSIDNQIDCFDKN